MIRSTNEELFMLEPATR